MTTKPPSAIEAAQKDPTIKEALIESAALTAHEMNRWYCATLGDDSQPLWADTPAEQREAVRAGVLAIWSKPEITPAESHQGWLNSKHDEGWSWGEEKDPLRKLHPCMVPYEQLPPEQKAKDAIFGAVVRAVLLVLDTVSVTKEPEAVKGAE